MAAFCSFLSLPLAFLLWPALAFLYSHVLACTRLLYLPSALAYCKVYICYLSKVFICFLHLPPGHRQSDSIWLNLASPNGSFRICRNWQVWIHLKSKIIANSLLSIDSPRASTSEFKKFLNQIFLELQKSRLISWARRSASIEETRPSITHQDRPYCSHKSICWTEMLNFGVL